MSKEMNERFLNFISNMKLNEKEEQEIIDLYNKIDPKDSEKLNNYMDVCDNFGNYNFENLKEKINDILDKKVNNFYTEIPKVEERQSGKVGNFFKKLKSKFTRKHNYTYEFGDEIPEVEERQSGKVGNFFKKLKSKFTRKDKKVSNNPEAPKKDAKVEAYEKNMLLINNYIKHCNFNNPEIDEYINLIKFREDKLEVTMKIVKYIIENKDANNEEEFLNVLSDALSIPRVKPNTKTVKPNSKTVKPVDKKEEKEIRLNEKYASIKEELFNNLGEYEKKFIEDMHAEGLEPGFPELDQMFAERSVNKAQIYKYLLSVEKIKMLNAYESLGEFEKMFIEDMNSECITRNDAEYDQMISERCVSKKAINRYIDTLEQSKIYQNKIVTDYTKKIEFEKSIDLTTKKKEELVNMASDNDINNISKMNKTQLIELLNQLNEMKLEQAHQELGLKK